MAPGFANWVSADTVFKLSLIPLGEMPPMAADVATESPRPSYVGIIVLFTTAALLGSIAAVAYRSFF